MIPEAATGCETPRLVLHAAPAGWRECDSKAPAVIRYSVMVGADSDGNKVVEATDKKTGETFVVRADCLYMAAVELAQEVGIDLSDG